MIASLLVACALQAPPCLISWPAYQPSPSPAFAFELGAPTNLTPGTRILNAFLYYPSSPMPPAGYPTVLYVHGGGWIGGDHTDWFPFFHELLAHGLVIVSIDYRLSSEMAFPAQIHDVKGAVRWLRSDPHLGVDPDRIGVWGTSAGAHLAALLATTGDLPSTHPLEGEIGGPTTYSSAVKAAVLYFPITDLLNAEPDFGGLVPHVNYDLPDSKIAKLIGLAPPFTVLDLRINCPSASPPYALACNRIRDANPITWISAQDPPIYMRHSEEDPMAPVASSKRLHSAYSAAGLSSTLFVIPGDQHRPFGAPDDCSSAKWIADQL
jgi:acetyl esterase/lipase